MLSFMTATADQQRDAAAWLAGLPRRLRKQYRPMPKRSARSAVASHDGVDSYMRTEYRTNAYLMQNHALIDHTYGDDEFNDVDNELDGLTIHEPDGDAALWAFCTGYDDI